MGGISVTSLLLILGIVILLFGTRKLKNLGGDLGSAIKSFKNQLMKKIPLKQTRINLQTMNN
ncbi:MAG: hypothetical protein CM15mP93_04490 [Thiotrichaceae bacterium]|nr:MAG: hypothetical protein CM15mP93_04490 [Thiotrichaceae bacterium]